MSLAELACLLEDAIDIHDRHWKIHWMLNFAQLSATLNLRAVMERTHGARRRGAAGPAPELGLGPQLGLDRGAVGDEGGGARRRRAARRLRGRRRRGDRRRAAGRERGRRFIAERVEPYQREFGWHAVWSHEFIFPTFREQMEPVDRARARLARQRLRLPDGNRGDAPRHRGRLGRDPRRASRARRSTRCAAANEINLRMAPLTPDHHFYIDQGANAHVRLVLIAIGEKLVEAGVLDAPDDVMFLRYNELRMLIGDADGDRRARDRGGAPGRARGVGADQAARLGRARSRQTQLAFPYLVNWGFPEQVPPRQRRAVDDGRVTGIAGSPGVVEGDRARGPVHRRVRRGHRRRHPRVPDDQPGLAGAVHARSPGS